MFDGRQFGYSYYSALIGVTDDERAVYDYDKMIEYLVTEHLFSYEDAVEWIEYNTIGSLGFEGGPVIIHSIRNEVG